MKNTGGKKAVGDLYHCGAPLAAILAAMLLEILFKNAYLKEIICLKAIFIIWLSWAIAVWGVNRFEHKFYPCMYFIIFSALYLVLFPLIAVVADAHFVIYDQEMHGYSTLFDLSALAIIVFTSAYCYVLNDHNKLMPPTIVNNKQSMPVIYISALTAIGAIAAMWLTQTASAYEVHGYEDVAPVFTGKGWVLRTSEMMAVAGLLFICSAKRLNSKFFYMGAALLLAFTLFRVQFLNRENIIKYGLIFAMYGIYAKKTKIKKKELALISAAITVLLLVIPYFAIFRAQLTNQSTTIDYWDSFARDLNFGEVAAVLFENENMKGVIGVVPGIKNIAAQLLPRIIFEDKPLSIGVQITAITTLVPFYNENAPAYSYAPTVLGVFYYISGAWLAMVYLAILGAASAAVSNWVDNEPQQNIKNIKMVTASVFIYHIIISSIKLEPGNALPAAIIPCLSAYLATTDFVLKRHFI